VVLVRIVLGASMIAALYLDQIIANDFSAAPRLVAVFALVFGMGLSMFATPWLRRTSTALCWIGTALYIVIVLTTFVPGEQSRLAGISPGQAHTTLLERVAFLTALAVGFLMASRASRST
jgi:hypothetical protein